MAPQLDFLHWLDHDTSLKILNCLEDISDLVRASSVSRFWRQFVIANGLSKQLCLRMFPDLHRVDCVIERGCGMKTTSEAGSSNAAEWEVLKREHRAYAFFARGCESFPLTGCLARALCASSTDNYPDESIHNTLEQRDRVGRLASYWSSKGQKDPAVPENLIYKLVADICVVAEISIQPFQAYFQWGLPIYSAKSVRFRMGHLKAPMDDPMGELGDWCEDKFVWTYTSPEFSMVQENRLQKFKLPEPVLCVGGILQVELSGRVQRQQMDDLFYICVSHVQVIGRPLSPSFGAKIVEPSGKFALEVLSYDQPTLPQNEPSGLPTALLQGRVRELDLIVNMLRGQGVIVEADGWNDDDVYLMDEDFAD